MNAPPFDAMNAPRGGLPLPPLYRNLHGANGHAHRQAHAPLPPPQVERLVSFFSGGRYVFFSIAATAVAVAATYQSVLAQRHTPIAEDPPAVAVSVSLAVEQELEPPGTVWQQFTKELLSSRLSSTIVLHFYFVVLYHIFLGVSHACFGAIRRTEIQQTKETILHFLLMRSLLLASTMGGAQLKPPVEMLLIWLSMVAFLRGILSICNARFDYLLTRPMTRAHEFHRLALTLLTTLVTNLFVALVATFCGLFDSSTIIHLTWFEAALFLIKASQLGTKIVFHLFDIGNNWTEDDESQEAENGPLEKGEWYLLVLQTALSFAHLVQLVWYYLYIISIDHFRVSFLDFILIVNVKSATVELLGKWSQVQLYQQVVMELDAFFANASIEELEAVRDDVCVICLKPMATEAKKLQCGHLFHRFCLRQCLQKASVGDSFVTRDPLAAAAAATVAAGGGAGGGATQGQAPQAPVARSDVILTQFRCPICRKSVSGEKQPHPQERSTTMAAEEERPVHPPAAPPQREQDHDGFLEPAHPQEQQQQQQLQPGQDDAAAAAAASPQGNVLRISTEFLSRWLPFVPHVAFEIVRPPAAAGAASFVVTEETVHRVLELFPQFAPETIRRDLLRTRSAERTIDRILSGRLQEQEELLDDGGVGGGGGGARRRGGDEAEMLLPPLPWDLSAIWDVVWGNTVRGEGENEGHPPLAPLPLPQRRQDDDGQHQ